MSPDIPGLEDAPFLTPEIPGIEGVLRRAPEDFVVEEIPLYTAAGEGDHLFFRVEKRGISTGEAIRRMARKLGVAPGALGYAGRKDANAVAVQHFTLKGTGEDRVRALQVPGIRILEVARHGTGCAWAT